MTNGPDEPPWSQPTAEEQAEYARREAAADHRHHHVPARDPAERAEYNWQEAAEAIEEEAEQRFIHFYGIHVQDPNVAHGNCVDYCPYDTPEQARERAERLAYAEVREAEYAAENNGGNITGPDSSPGEWAGMNTEEVAAYDDLYAALRAEETARQDARAASQARWEALMARQKASWPSRAHDEASVRVTSASAAHLTAREAYRAARLAATSMAGSIRSRRAALDARAGRRQQCGARPADHSPPYGRPSAEPGHGGPVPRM